MSEAICGKFPPDVAALIRATATTSYRSALQRLQRGRGARPQKAHVAADGEEAHPALGERNGTLDRITAAATKAGKVMGAYCHSAERAIALAKRGVRFLAVGSDMGFLRAGAAAALKALKG